ncbi:MAG: hypothetical protein HSCHL_0665 [Hydrogenibacillus schlegelii]|uniref:Mobile element protein n=1 Tax=Hydrogenibacillus schlegelii TaxID=1484 RepID=A0A2T5G7T3_HYDSH|nr:MAG: hypothetical protein HSCHL_0665 [Hydrogenibacillus schlegelii]
MAFCQRRKARETNKIHPRLHPIQSGFERIKGEKTLVELSREYGVHPNTLLKGKLTLLEKGAELFEPPNKERIPEAHS